ncbi:MAG: hypothetical protein U0270_32880 [Labilithrix sp.]
MRTTHVLLSGLVLAACSEKKPAPSAPLPAPKADIEPMLDAAAPEWPGWPLPAGQPVTAAMICRAFLSPGSDLKDRCARQYDPLESTRDYLATAVKECVPRVERSLQNGRAEINQTEAVKCLGKRMEFRRSGRTDIAGTEWEHACDALFTGKAAPGTMCREDWECTPGFACAIGRNSKIGKCTTPSALNGPCAATDLHLAPSRVCSPDTYCSADTCRRRDQEGEGCGPYSCAEGTFCSTGLHKCVKALGAAGAKCSRHDDCAVGFWCDVKTCAPQKNVGAKCLDSIECRGDCDRGACIGRCG